VVRTATRALRSAARPGAHLVERLVQTIASAERIVAQTTRRIGGETTIPDRVISLSETDARPIRRGKPQKMTEFGLKTATADTPEDSWSPTPGVQGQPHRRPDFGARRRRSP
jgi:IS5 family transposase